MTKIKKDWRDRFNDVVSDWERAAEVNMCAALYGAIEDFIDQALKQQREEILEYLGMEKLDLIDFDMRSNCDLNWAKGYAVCREKLNAKIKEIRGGKMKKNFIRFKECNSWEGETWNFYIPVEGNEKAIKRLAKILEKYPSYTLYPIPLSEKEVDILVKNNNEIGYMARHDKLEGKLDFSDFPNKSINGEEDPFYKGDIKEYLKGEK